MMVVALLAVCCGDCNLMGCSLGMDSAGAGHPLVTQVPPSMLHVLWHVHKELTSSWLPELCLGI
jgi:hypothetical protein